MASSLSWEVVPTPRPHKSPSGTFGRPLQTTKLQPESKENALTKSDLMFIKDLNPSEKSKIAFMIQQIVKLEQTCAKLTEDLEKMKCKFEKKSVLCEELEGCLERLTSENGKLKAENKSQSQVLSEYSCKLEETSKLLKTTSNTNTKLQKRLNVKHRHVQIQTEGDSKSTLTQTDCGDSPGDGSNTVQGSMNLFLTKLDTLCDKLSTVDREPVQSVPFLTHNHKREGELVNVQTTHPDITYQAEEVGHTIRSCKLKDSVLLVREHAKRRQDKMREEESPARFSRQIISLIEEMEHSHSQDEDSLLNDLFFKVE